MRNCAKNARVQKKKNKALFILISAIVCHVSLRLSLRAKSVARTDGINLDCIRRFAVFKSQYVG